MLQITIEFKEQVIKSLAEARERFEGSNADFARKFGLNASVYSRIKNGETENILSEPKWLHIGRILNVNLNASKWKIAKTDVFKIIEEDILFCKEFCKGNIIVEECGIGKTFTAKYLSKILKNAFYIDCKQVKTRQLFIRSLAKDIGLDSTGRYSDVKSDLKYYISILTKPIVILDDAGYADYSTLMEVMELIDSTEGVCGWYLIGDDSLREKIERGINGRKVGYRAMFSRLGNRYTTVVPVEKTEKVNFYKKLIRDVLTVNVDPGDNINIDQLVLKCLRSDSSSTLGDLRRAESILKLKKMSNESQLNN